MFTYDEWEGNTAYIRVSCALVDPGDRSKWSVFTRGAGPHLLVVEWRAFRIPNANFFDTEGGVLVIDSEDVWLDVDDSARRAPWDRDSGAISGCQKGGEKSKSEPHV